MVTIKEALTFDDILMLPRYSNVLPINTNIALSLTKNIELRVPFLSSAMDTVTESGMAIAMGNSGGMGIIHRNLKIKTQSLEVKKVKRKMLLVGAAIGTNQEDLDRARVLKDSGVDLIVIDTAHGHSSKVLKVLSKIKKINNKTPICVGNIATGEAATRLYNSGADIIKVGIGPGSICTTRIVAGVGVPQITAIAEVASATKGTTVKVIADGGIRFSGDIAKALAAGADSVMLGSLFAGTTEAPGEIELYQGRTYKSYRGMGSIGAMKSGSSERYFQEQETASEKLVPEGIEGRVPFKGPMTNILHQLLGGIRSSMGYLGCANIKELHTKAKFVKITNAGMRESHVHDVAITKEAPNYQIDK